MDDPDPRLLQDLARALNEVFAAGFASVALAKNKDVAPVFALRITGGPDPPDPTNVLEARPRLEQVRLELLAAAAGLQDPAVVQRWHKRKVNLDGIDGDHGELLRDSTVIALQLDRKPSPPGATWTTREGRASEKWGRGSRWYDRNVRAFVAEELAQLLVAREEDAAQDGAEDDGGDNGEETPPVSEATKRAWTAAITRPQRLYVFLGLGASIILAAVLVAQSASRDEPTRTAETAVTPPEKRPGRTEAVSVGAVFEASETSIRPLRVRTYLPRRGVDIYVDLRVRNRGKLPIQLSALSTRLRRDDGTLYTAARTLSATVQPGATLQETIRFELPTKDTGNLSLIIAARGALLDGRTVAVPLGIRRPPLGEGRYSGQTTQGQRLIFRLKDGRVRLDRVVIKTPDGSLCLFRGSPRTQVFKPLGRWEYDGVIFGRFRSSYQAVGTLSPLRANGRGGCRRQDSPRSIRWSARRAGP